jgi:hypothetical protein
MCFAAGGGGLAGAALYEDLDDELELVQRVELFVRRDSEEIHLPLQRRFIDADDGPEARGDDLGLARQEEFPRIDVRGTQGRGLHGGGIEAGDVSASLECRAPGESGFGLRDRRRDLALLAESPLGVLC